MSRKSNSTSGHAIVESLLLIPILSLMLAGIHAAGNHLSILSVSESASHTEALRNARRQGSVASNWNEFLPAEKPLHFDLPSGSGARILPSPFPSLAGRAKVSVSVDRKWDQWTRNSLKIETQQLKRSDELSGDCWDGGSGSGRKIRSTVTILAGTGIF